MNKLYNRQTWHNNTTPALNETNLNILSKAVDDIDDRVIEIAGDVLVVVPEILEKYADIEALATNPPYIGQNGNWWTWDTDLNQYVDSGVDAGVSVNVGTTSTLPAGSSATVTNSGTDTDPILNFGIPQGVAGQNGQDGVSPEVTIGTITGGHSVTITDADHPTGQSFNVMDGTNGQGVPASGTTGQLLAKASGTDYDTEWITPSGGSGGHTILNGSGSAMNQRSKLQFVGGNVKDDSTNDKTVVTVARELTQAEYDALSTAEKNNGTTYYIKDAPSSYTGVPQSMISDAWASGQSYVAGQYRIDGNVLYKCKQDHTSSSSNRPPYASYWDAVSVASQLDKEWTYLDSVSMTTSATAEASNSKNVNIDISNYKELKILIHSTNQHFNEMTWDIADIVTNTTNSVYTSYVATARDGGIGVCIRAGISNFSRSKISSLLINGYYATYSIVFEAKIYAR